LLLSFKKEAGFGAAPQRVKKIMLTVFSVCDKIHLFAARRGFLKRLFAAVFGELLFWEVVFVYAIIETGGKQYKVSEGDVIRVEKLSDQIEGKYVFDTVLAVGNDDDFKFGSPSIEGASVEASVIGNGKAKKVIVYKYKPKKTFHKKKGHRQPYTELKIEKIVG